MGFQNTCSKAKLQLLQDVLCIKKKMQPRVAKPSSSHLKQVSVGKYSVYCQDGREGNLNVAASFEAYFCHIGNCLSSTSTHKGPPKHVHPLTFSLTLRHHQTQNTPCNIPWATPQRNKGVMENGEQQQRIMRSISAAL